MTVGAGSPFLLVGDSADVPELRRIVSRLPAGAYGQVFVEVATSRQIQAWELPERMTATWLCRDRKAELLGGLVPRGELAASAVAGWTAEWITERSRRPPFTLWIGCAGAERVEQVCEALLRRFGHLHLHRPESASDARGGEPHVRR